MRPGCKGDTDSVGVGRERFPGRVPPDLVLGTKLNDYVPAADQERQRGEVNAILTRLRRQPGVILADEVGMGETFVALAIACSVATRSPRGPVIVMVPANLIDKWQQDLAKFCELYLENRHPVCCHGARRKELIAPESVRYGTARHSVELMRLTPPNRLPSAGTATVASQRAAPGHSGPIPASDAGATGFS